MERSIEKMKALALSVGLQMVGGKEQDDKLIQDAEKAEMRLKKKEEFRRLMMMPSTILKESAIIKSKDKKALITAKMAEAVKNLQDAAAAREKFERERPRTLADRLFRVINEGEKAAKTATERPSSGTALPVSSPPRSRPQSALVPQSEVGGKPPTDPPRSRPTTASKDKDKDDGATGSRPTSSAKRRKKEKGGESAAAALEVGDDTSKAASLKAVDTEHGVIEDNGEGGKEAVEEETGKMKKTPKKKGKKVRHPSPPPGGMLKDILGSLQPAQPLELGSNLNEGAGPIDTKTAIIGASSGRLNCDSSS